jgi:hypothetical protein
MYSSALFGATLRLPRCSSQVYSRTPHRALRLKARRRLPRFIFTWLISRIIGNCLLPAGGAALAGIAVDSRWEAWRGGVLSIWVGRMAPEMAACA